MIFENWAFTTKEIFIEWIDSQIDAMKLGDADVTCYLELQGLIECRKIAVEVQWDDCYLDNVQERIHGDGALYHVTQRDIMAEVAGMASKFEEGEHGIQRT